MNNYQYLFEDYSKEKDSLGRLLTRAQSKFFSDSKCRDKDGNLLAVYHGSQNIFNTFMKSKLGSSNDFGYFNNGFYFSDDIKSSKSFGGKDCIIYECYLNMKNPLILKTEKDEQAYFEKYFNEEEMHDALLKDGFSEKEIKSEKFNVLKVNTPNLSKFRKNGLEKFLKDYDGIYTQYKITGKNNMNQMVVYNSNQIKLCTNLNPSSSNNMRESL